MQLADPIKNIDTQTVGKETDNIFEIDFHNIKKASLILRSLNHKLRQQILRIIYEENKITVTEIYVKLRLEQSVARWPAQPGYAPPGHEGAARDQVHPDQVVPGALTRRPSRRAGGNEGGMA